MEALVLKILAAALIAAVSLFLIKAVFRLFLTAAQVALWVGVLIVLLQQIEPAWYDQMLNLGAETVRLQRESLRELQHEITGQQSLGLAKQRVTESLYDLRVYLSKA